MGAAIKKILKFAESVINVFGLGGLGLNLRRYFLLFVNFFKEAWETRPSLIQSFID